MTAPTLNAFVQALVGQLDHCLTGGMTILLLAGMLAYLLRRESSRARFAIWLGGLVAIAALPLCAMAWSLETSHGLSPAPTGAAAITLPAAWAFYLCIGWLAVVGCALARLGMGFCQVLRLRRRSTELDPRTLAMELQQTLQQFRPAREVAILVSDQIQSPTAIGLLSPAIVLPRWILTELTTLELRQILLHELAHLRRWDDWSNLLQKIVGAFLFFHPAVWWMERQISLEREMACDEAVLAQTGNPRAYAQCLVALAEKSFFRRSVMLAQAAVSRVGQTSRRIARILSEAPAVPVRMRMAAAPVCAAVLVAGVALVGRAPRLIAFQDHGDLAKIAEPQGALSLVPKVVPASFHPADAFADAANMSERAVAKVSPARLRGPGSAADQTRGAMPRPVSSGNAVVAVRLGSGGLIPATTVLAPARTSQEVVVVFVSSSWSGFSAEPVWQIQMWRFTLLPITRNPAPQATPQKVI